MHRAWASLLVGIIATTATSCADAAPVTEADRAAFCELMLEPPPREAFLNASDRAARRRVDTWTAAAERLAPRDIEAEATKYRRATHVSLRSRASGSVDEKARKQQFNAGQAINAYVDAHCL